MEDVLNEHLKALEKATTHLKGALSAFNEQPENEKKVVWNTQRYAGIIARLSLEREKIAMSIDTSRSRTLFDDMCREVYEENGYGVEMLPEKWLRAVIPTPGKLQGQKDRANLNEIRHILRLGRSELVKTYDIGELIFKHCTVIYRYVQGTNVGSLNDYDNYDIKSLTDLISTYYILGDSAQNIRQYFLHQQTKGDSYFVIYLVPNSDFSKWLQLCENQKESKNL